MSDLPCYGDCRGIMALLRFASSLFSALERTLTPKFGNSFLMEESTQSGRQTITSTAFRTLALLESEARCLIFFSPLQRIPFWRAGRWRTLSLSFGCTFRLKIVFHCTLFSSVVHCMQSPSSLFCFALWLQQRQKRAFSSGLSLEEKCVSRISVRDTRQPSLSVSCSL